MFHNLFDSHMHSDSSHDGHHSVIYMAEQAEKIGLTGIAVTDHADCYIFRQDNGLTRIIQSVVDTSKAGVAFRNRLTFSTGLELGYGGDKAMADRIVALYPFDFILGAIHFSFEGADYYQLDYAAMTLAQRHRVLEGYFREVLAMVKWGNFDSLAHLTYPLRSAARQQVELDLTAHKEAIDEILSALVHGGKALEVNTSGLRSPLGDTLPPAWVLRRFKELGGEYVTLGSDAHRVEHVGFGIQEGMELLHSLGFEFFAFYRRRSPVLLRIV